MTSIAQEILGQAQDRLEMLNRELFDVRERRVCIRGKIEKAETDQRLGVRIDLDWLRRAKGALRHLGVTEQDLLREVGDLNRAIRRATGENSSRLFAQAVREFVDDTTWDAIVTRHHQLCNEESSRLSPTKEASR